MDNREVYQETLNRLREVHPNQEVISLNACAKYLHRDARTLLQDKHFPAKKIGKSYCVPLISLARWLTV